MEGILSTSKFDQNCLSSALVAHGRFLCAQTCQLEVNRKLYKYARLRKSNLIALRNTGSSDFKEIFIAQNNYSSLNFIFLVKSAQY